MVRRAAERQIMDFPFSPYNNATDPNDIIWRLDTEEYAILLGGGAADGGGDSTKNLVRYLNLSGANLTTDFNRTYVVYEATYPSVYSLPSIIVASIFAIILMIFVVVGNLLVIVAIVTEKALKNIQNWFIASLAVADFFLGVVVIPFSLANELMGYWVFGSMWCDIHSAIDVLLCTASIMNLCLISLDRYWSITKAVEYLKQRTSFRAGVMITLVWILSAVICIPPLLGWKVKRPPELYPKCENRTNTEASNGKAKKSSERLPAVLLEYHITTVVIILLYPATGGVVNLLRIFVDYDDDDEEEKDEKSNKRKKKYAKC